MWNASERIMKHNSTVPVHGYEEEGVGRTHLLRDRILGKDSRSANENE
jgi:hypothetical protein